MHAVTRDLAIATFDGRIAREGVITVKWLRTSGAGIVTDDGEPVLLRGVGVGGWLNMENFITGFPATESSHRAALRRALGGRRAALLLDSLLMSFFGPPDAEFIASLGMNCVRIPVNYRHWEDDARPGEIEGTAFALLDRAVDACAAVGLYTVIDLHAVPGGQNHHWHSDNPFHQPLFWQHRSFQDRAVALWEAIASRYASRPEVAGYNVLNEPADETRTALAGFYQRAVAAIRAVDGRHMVFLDGNRYARDFEGFGEPFENAVYAVHQYPPPGAADGGPYPGPTAGRHFDVSVIAAEFASLTGYMREHGLPVWVGEFGPVYGAGTERDAQRLRLLADQIAIYTRAGAGWSLWTYKDIGVQGLVVADPGSAWMRRTEAVRAKKARLAADHWGTTTEGMRDVLDPLMARFEREFGGFDPYPFGARRYVEQLVLSMCFAEPLADEFAACFADASDAELVALGECFAFGNCRVSEQLCSAVSATLVPAAGESLQALEPPAPAGPPALPTIPAGRGRLLRRRAAADVHTADEGERAYANHRGAWSWLRPAIDPGAADQVEARHLNPDALRDLDPGPAHQGHLGQRDLRRGKLRLAQVQPRPADEADGDDVPVHPPRPGNAQPADGGDVPGSRRGAPRRDGDRLGGQIGHQPVKLSPRPGRCGLLHPLTELLERQPAVPGRRAQPPHGRVPLAVRRPDARLWFTVARCSAHRCLPVRGLVAARTLAPGNLASYDAAIDTVWTRGRTRDGWPAGSDRTPVNCGPAERPCRASAPGGGGRRSPHGRGRAGRVWRGWRGRGS